jgi:hypothetical protein
LFTLELCRRQEPTRIVAQNNIGGDSVNRKKSTPRIRNIASPGRDEPRAIGAEATSRPLLTNTTCDTRHDHQARLTGMDPHHGPTHGPWTTQENKGEDCLTL